MSLCEHKCVGCGETFFCEECASETRVCVGLEKFRCWPCEEWGDGQNARWVLTKFNQRGEQA